MNSASTETRTMVSSTDSALSRRIDDALLHEYESAIAASTRMRHAIAFSYGRSALWSTLSALHLKPGREVVLSPLTCEVVPLVLLGLGLRPVYADIDPNTLNLDAETAKRALTPATGAILFQHTYGISAGVREVRALARSAGLPLIEDCAQCLPVAHGPAPPGQDGGVVIYSNNLRKPLPAGGGGLAVTNDGALADEIRCLRDKLPAESLGSRLRLRGEVWLHRHVLRPSRYWLLYGLSRRYLAGQRHPSITIAIAAQIEAVARKPSAFRVRQGLAWVARMSSVAAHGHRCVEDYARSLQSSPELLIPAAADESVLYYFPVRVRRKDELLHRARERKIELIAWPLRTPIFPLEHAADAADLGYETGMCPQADRMASELVGLPTELEITSDHRQAIVALVRDAAEP